MTETIALPEELLALRASLDNLDASIISILAERFKMTRRVGQLKAQYRLPATDAAREDSQMVQLRRLAEEAQLDPAFAERFLRFVIDEVVRHHESASQRQAGAAK